MDDKKFLVWNEGRYTIETKGESFDTSKINTLNELGKKKAQTMIQSIPRIELL